MDGWRAHEACWDFKDSTPLLTGVALIVRDVLQQSPKCRSGRSMKVGGRPDAAAGITTLGNCWSPSLFEYRDEAYLVLDGLGDEEIERYDSVYRGRAATCELHRPPPRPCRFVEIEASDRQDGGVSRRRTWRAIGPSTRCAYRGLPKHFADGSTGEWAQEERDEAAVERDVWELSHR